MSEWTMWQFFFYYYLIVKVNPFYGAKPPSSGLLFMRATIDFSIEQKQNEPIVETLSGLVVLTFFDWLFFSLLLLFVLLFRFGFKHFWNFVLYYDSYHNLLLYFFQLCKQKIILQINFEQIIQQKLVYKYNSVDYIDCNETMRRGGETSG